MFFLRNEEKLNVELNGWNYKLKIIWFFIVIFFNYSKDYGFRGVSSNRGVRFNSWGEKRLIIY